MHAMPQSESTHQMFRPPAERASVLIRVADGCPHNACAFCAMYRGVRYRVHESDAVTRAIALAAAANPEARRVFLADGDVLALPQADLLSILALLERAFPSLSRVACYASGQSLSAKSERDLAALRAAKLRIVYLGLESGCERVLRRMNKGESAANMIRGVCRAQGAGLAASVMALVGIGGKTDSPAHVRDTIEVINAMQPRLLSCLRLIPIPGTLVARWIAAGRFSPLTELDAVRELRDLLDGLRPKRTVFRADHGSNILPLSGKLPADRERLLAELDELLAADVLDREGPGPMPRML